MAHTHPHTHTQTHTHTEPWDPASLPHLSPSRALLTVSWGFLSLCPWMHFLFSSHLISSPSDRPRLPHISASEQGRGGGPEWGVC